MIRATTSVATKATTSHRPSPPASKTAFDTIKKIGKDVSVKFLGEDDSGSVERVYFRKATAFTAQAMAEALGFNGKRQVASGDYAFGVATPDDLQAFIDNQDDEKGAKTAKRIVNLLSKPGVQVATMVMGDRKPFSAPAFLAARFPDGQVIALRGTVGGMSI